VDSYPVQEKYGFIWAFLGDAAEADRPPLPDFDEYDDPKWRKISGQFQWKANYARITENGIDPSHAAFVHPSFGDREAPEIHDFKLTQDQYSAFAEITFLPPQFKGLWRHLRKERTPVTVRNGFHVSGAHVRIEIHITSTWSMVIFDVNTPIDECNTITRFVMARNFMTSPIFDSNSRKRTMRIFAQDNAVMEKIAPELLPIYLHEEVSVKSDAIMVAWRTKRRELIENGWAIDVNAMERDVKGKRAMVIPSPDRADPAVAKDFVLKTVPLLDGEAVRQEALEQRHGAVAQAAE
jgi:phenylpropionate dioxygenase-like ring-hydroxylating dioxygenase large terminal subunit